MFRQERTCARSRSIVLRVRQDYSLALQTDETSSSVTHLFAVPRNDSMENVDE
jgi:hypothetical protein